MAARASRARLVSSRAPRASRARRNPERVAASRAAVARASVSEAFRAVLDDGKRAFIPFICAGDPDLESTKKALKILDDAGRGCHRARRAVQRSVGGRTGDSGRGDAGAGERGDVE